MNAATVDELLARSSFLLDTSVISYAVGKKTPHAGIAQFFARVDEDRLFLSILTIGEIQKGIDLIPWPGRPGQDIERRRVQAAWEQRLEALIERFEDRVIVPDVRVAREWGRLHAQRERVGKPSSVVDTMIAACAKIHYLTVASADGDFEVFDGLTVYNPRTKLMSGHIPWSAS